MTPAAGDEAVVRLYNANTQKKIIARFALDAGCAAVEGDFELQGVARRGAPIRSSSRTRRRGHRRAAADRAAVRDADVPGLGEVRASIVDADDGGRRGARRDLELRGDELPDAIEADPELLARLEAIRGAAAVRIGLSPSVEEAAERSPQSPLVALVAAPQPAQTLAGAELAAGDVDLTARVLSMGQAHRALPLTAAMCLAVAARIEGSVVHELARQSSPEADLRLGNPSGVLPVAATVRHDGSDSGWVAEDVVVYRTARRLMEGRVLVPESRLAAQDSSK